MAVTPRMWVLVLVGLGIAFSAAEVENYRSMECGPTSWWWFLLPIVLASTAGWVVTRLWDVRRFHRFGRDLAILVAVVVAFMINAIVFSTEWEKSGCLASPPAVRHTGSSPPA